ncbi:hypothetical protein [Tomitella biformata]|uniref:hypothetical protein n=1 Tax=Tomitella biformata TaxID=630403 RepID=UPI0004B77F01|nr:hypothetical protein [Tomitella biformata]
MVSSLLIALVVAGLVAALATLLVAGRGDSAEDARRAAFIDTARQSVQDLTTLRSDSARADIDRLLAASTGEFRATFGGRADSLAKAVESGQVDAEGKVEAVGIEQVGEDQAVLLVAANQTITNSDNAESEVRTYRFRVTVVEEDGRTAVSGMEFVN